MGARSKLHIKIAVGEGRNSRVPRWGHDQNVRTKTSASKSLIAECPDGGTIIQTTQPKLEARPRLLFCKNCLRPRCNFDGVAPFWKVGLATDVWARSATSTLESVLKVGKLLPNPVQLPQGNEQKEERGKRRVIRWRENQKGKRKKAENEIDGKVGSPRSCLGDNVLNVRDAHSCINRQRTQLGQGKDRPRLLFLQIFQEARLLR